MHSLEFIQALAALMQAAAQLARRLPSAGSKLSDVVDTLVRPLAYENLFIDLEVDIQDPHGKKALLAKRQRVKFRSALAGPVRDIVWGKGGTLARYLTKGASKLGVQSEGSRKAVLLGLLHQPAKGEKATVESRRLIEDGFGEADEYFETFVERPTRRLSLKIVFPRSRPPRYAHLVEEGPRIATRPIPLRFDANGRPFLVWRRGSPAEFRVYSLRWRW